MAAASVGVLVVFVGGTRSLCRRPAGVVVVLLLLLLWMPGAIQLLVGLVASVWCTRRLVRAGVSCGCCG